MMSNLDFCQKAGTIGESQELLGTTALMKFDYRLLKIWTESKNGMGNIGQHWFSNH